MAAVHASVLMAFKFANKLFHCMEAHLRPSASCHMMTFAAGLQLSLLGVCRNQAKCAASAVRQQCAAARSLQQGAQACSILKCAGAANPLDTDTKRIVRLR